MKDFIIAGFLLLFSLSNLVGQNFRDAFFEDGWAENIGFKGHSFPEFSYPQLPEGFDKDSIPHHWKVLLQRVEPPEND